MSGLQRAYCQVVPGPEDEPSPRDTTSTAQARLRMVRVHAEQALGEKERRRSDAPAVRDAQSIAREQLDRVADVHGDAVEPLVIDVPALQHCPDAQAQPILTFAEQILAQRKQRRTPDKVFLRRDDVDTLSDLLRCPPEAVTPLLVRLGVLA